MEAIIKIECNVEELWSLFHSQSYLEKIHPLCLEHINPHGLSVGNKELVKYKDHSIVEREVISIKQRELIHFLVRDERNKSESNVVWKTSQNNPVELSILITTKAFSKVPRIYWRTIKRQRAQKAYKIYLEPLLIRTKAFIESQN